MLDAWEEEEFRKRFSAYSPLGALDWTPMAVAPGPMRVAVYDPRDRNSAQPIVMQTINRRGPTTAQSSDVTL